MTLENIDRAQLIALSKFLNMDVFGTDAYLRHHIEQRLKEIKRDDNLIISEGLDSLSLAELQQICADRGMRSTDTEEEMRRSLKNWLDWSLNKNVPPMLLLISRSMTIAGPSSYSPDLRSALSSLPEAVVDEIGSDLHAPRATQHQMQLDVLQQQQELIREEREILERTPKGAPVVAAAAAVKPVAPSLASPVAAHPELKQPMLRAEELWTRVAELTRAIQTFSGSSVQDERARLAQLRSEQSELRAEILAVTLPHWRRRDALSEGDLHASRLISAQLDQMFAKLEVQMRKIDQAIGEKLHIVDHSKQGLVSEAELSAVSNRLKTPLREEELRFVIERLDEDRDGFIKVQDLFKKAESASLESRNREGMGRRDQHSPTPSAMA